MNGRKGVLRMLELFLTFFKIGLFTFGGGYAMISLIEDTCVERKQWITHEEMMDLTVVAESTPGPIAINCATFVGFCRGGFWGSVAATVGVVLPSFLIIYAISMFFDSFLEIPLIANAFKGIKLAVGLLILNAGLNMLQKMKKTALSLVILVCGCIALIILDVFALSFSSIGLMCIAGAVSLAVFAAQQKGGGI